MRDRRLTRPEADHAAPIRRRHRVLNCSVTDRLRPPPDLTGAACATFVRIVCACRASHFDDSNVDLLVEYCESVVQAKATRLKLAEVGYGRAVRSDPGAGAGGAGDHDPCASAALEPPSQQAPAPKEAPLPLSYPERVAVQRRRFDARLAGGEDYAKVGEAAAYHCQIEALGLMPWQSPPCYPTMSALNEPYGDVGAKREIAELAMRMCRLSVSRWHPDPARECDRIEAEQKLQAAR